MNGKFLSIVLFIDMEKTEGIVTREEERNRGLRYYNLSSNWRGSEVKGKRSQTALSLGGKIRYLTCRLIYTRQ